MQWDLKTPFDNFLPYLIPLAVYFFGLYKVKDAFNESIKKKEIVTRKITKHEDWHFNNILQAMEDNISLRLMSEDITNLKENERLDRVRKRDVEELYTKNKKKMYSVWKLEKCWDTWNELERRGHDLCVICTFLNMLFILIFLCGIFLDIIQSTTWVYLLGISFGLPLVLALIIFFKCRSYRETFIILDKG